MKNFLHVTAFESKIRIRQKAFWVTTLLITLMFFAATFAPHIIGFFSRAETPSPDDPKPAEEAMAVVYEAGIPDTLKAMEPFASAKVLGSEAELRDELSKGKYGMGVVLTDTTSYKALMNDQSISSRPTEGIDTALREWNTNERLNAAGIDPAAVDEAMAVEITPQMEFLGQNPISGYLFAFIATFVVYMMIIMYGNTVATSVAREKDSRTMEILVTTTPPEPLIWGKVAASTLLSILQLLILVAVVGVGLWINRAGYPPQILEAILSSFTMRNVGWLLVFTLLGSMLYYFLFAASGALSSKVEDAASASAPIQFVFVISYILSLNLMQFPDGLITKVLSIFPLSSPLGMVTRMNVTQVPAWEFYLSIGLLILTTILVAWLASRIYRLGTLTYGNKMSFLKAMRLLRQNAEE